MLCPGVNTCVGPSGPTDTNILFCGEAPGKDEDRKGMPFIGKTGREVNEHYLPLAGLRRDSSYFTNAIRCLPVSSDGRLDINRAKDVALLESCTGHNLYNEIAAIQPKLIVPMGAFACRAIDPSIDLDMHHGMPLELPIGNVFPMWHPAGGVHEPKKMLQIRTDWVRLRRYLLGRLVVPTDQYPNPDYAEVTSTAEIDLIDPTHPMACDTESSRRKGPYCLTYSQIPGVARLIRAERKDLLEYFQTKLDEWESIIIFHNWIYDKRIVTDMGLYFHNDCIRDSMVRAFHLGNLPQGLKVLAFRLLGMKMQDFSDLVTPHSTVQCMEYIRTAYAEDFPKPEEQLVRGPDNKWKMYRPQSISTKLKRFFTDFRKNPKLDVIARWDNWESSWVEIEGILGPFPGLDIIHAPWDDVLHYACRDADATLRLWSVLEKMKEKAMTGAVQENWDV